MKAKLNAENLSEEKLKSSVFHLGQPAIITSGHPASILCSNNSINPHFMLIHKSPSSDNYKYYGSIQEMKSELIKENYSNSSNLMDPKNNLVKNNLEYQCSNSSFKSNKETTKKSFLRQNLKEKTESLNVTKRFSDVTFDSSKNNEMKSLLLNDEKKFKRKTIDFSLTNEVHNVDIYGSSHSIIPFADEFQDEDDEFLSYTANSDLLSDENIVNKDATD